MKHLGLKLAVPDEFAVDQAMVSFRAPAPVAGDPRVLRRQTVVRPSLIVHRREVGDTGLEILAGEVAAELLSSIGGLSGLVTEPIAYVDGTHGVVVSFDFGSVEVGTARQFHALRKDAGVLTTVTLTLDKMQLNDTIRQKWLTLLASTVPEGDGALP
jgi:hypothetical protein